MKELHIYSDGCISCKYRIQFNRLKWFARRFDFDIVERRSRSAINPVVINPATDKILDLAVVKSYTDEDFKHKLL